MSLKNVEESNDGGGCMLYDVKTVREKTKQLAYETEIKKIALRKLELDVEMERLHIAEKARLEEIQIKRYMKSLHNMENRICQLIVNSNDHSYYITKDDGNTLLADEIKAWWDYHTEPGLMNVTEFVNMFCKCFKIQKAGRIEVLQQLDHAGITYTVDNHDMINRVHIDVSLKPRPI